MPLTPVFVEKASGDQQAPALEEEHGGVDPDPRIGQYVTYVGSKMLPYSLRGKDPHQFKVLKSNDIINAFTLGNGNIYITRGLLNMLGDEAELAEVLGHENGHYGHRHIAASIDEAVGIGGLLALAEGIYSVQKGGKVPAGSQELIDTAAQVATSLTINGFSRAHESEADGHGLDTMVKAGYDPMGSVRTFQRFQKLEGEVPALETFFRSHPLAKTRIADLTSEIRSKYPGVTGQAYADRYQAIIHGGASLSDFHDDGAGKVLGMPTPVAVGVGAALVIGVGVVIASL